MVDFKKLKSQRNKVKVIDPIEIFRRLPKPLGINDLYTSQAEVLSAWFACRSNKDTVLKLHTGGGKTLVGLLIAQSTLYETNEPVLYLVPTIQLVNQTIAKAHSMGIPAVPYEKGKHLNDEFINANAIMVGTYSALFNGRSKFGTRGARAPQEVSAIILDDAHSAFSIIRDSFTLDVSSSNDLYEHLTGLFRYAFSEIDRLGTFDDVVSGVEHTILEVPYWAWNQHLDTVRECLRENSDQYGLEWPLLRDQLHLCHAFISKNAFTITPILPLVNQFPTFVDAPRRIYMSATIADDSDIIRTFDASEDSVRNALASRSLAGISERMVLIPELIPLDFNVENIFKLAEWTSNTKKLGSVILVSSDKNAEKWEQFATIAKGASEAENCISDLQQRKILGPVVFANRYDGIDLPGDSCRLLIMDGAPLGSSTYELFKNNVLHGTKTMTKALAQRIEQGIGRGARGAGDYCVVIFAGTDLSNWVTKNKNFDHLTSATKAQLEMGINISREIEDLKDLANIVNKCFDRDKDWIEYHAEVLADLIVDESQDEIRFKQAIAERKSFNLWHDGHHSKALSKIDKYLSVSNDLDSQTHGWMNQFAARVACHWGVQKLANDLQQSAFADNRNLIRPKILPPYRPLPIPDTQSKSIANRIGEYKMRQGFMIEFDECVALLTPNSTANQFEQSLYNLAKMIGLDAERKDTNGEGPDVLWLLPNMVGFVIEVKSRKKSESALKKEEHGQLLVASEWFSRYYPDHECIRISVHPTNQATRASVAGASHALTLKNLNALIADARALLLSLCDTHLYGDDLLVECTALLSKSNIRSDRLANNYLELFQEME